MQSVKKVETLIGYEHCPKAVHGVTRRIWHGSFNFFPQLSECFRPGEVPGENWKEVTIQFGLGRSERSENSTR